MKKLNVLVTTCDKFQDLWENQIKLMDKYWKEHPTVYLISDKNSSENVPQNSSLIWSENDYSYRLLNALKSIDCEYVFITLDDYLICDYVDNAKIQKLISIMDEQNLDYIRLFKKVKTKGWINKEEKLHSISYKHNCYEVNLYPGIWRKESLMKIIYQEENPWKFEVRMTRRCRERNFKCGWIDNKKIYPFVDTIRKGKYLRDAYKFLKKNDLYISNREIRTRGETFKLNVRTFISEHSPNWLKKFLKKISGKTYFSDYADNDD